MTTMRPWVLAASLLLVLPTAAATTRYVDDDTCPGVGTGTSGDPYCSVQTAVGASTSGDTILVRPGTYFECINAKNPARAVAIVAEDPDPTTTVLDGSSCFSVSVVVLSDGGSLSGFRITNGNEGGVAASGGVVITNNLIEGNSAGLSGGGIFVDTAAEDYTGPRTIDVVIENNTIRNNDSQRDGGGIWVDARSAEGIDAKATVQDNTLTGNTAAGVGAGIAGLTSAAFDSAATIHITQNVIQGNEVFAAGAADGFGGGIWVSTSSAGYETIRIDDNTVGAPAGSSDPALGNVAENNGGGISASILAIDSADHAVFIENNVVRSNFALGDAGGIELFIDGVSLDQAGNPTPGRFTALIADNAVGVNDAAGFGGGILADVGCTLTVSRRNPVDVSRNTLSGNTAEGGGGGIEARAFSFGTSFCGVSVRHNSITNNVAANATDDAFAGGLSLFAQAEGAGISRLDARFNTITGNTADIGGGGIDVAAVTVPDAGNNGSTFVEISNSTVENNVGWGVGGPAFDSPGSFQLTLRSLDLSPNTEGTIEDTLDPVLVCMPAASPAAVAFPGLDSDTDVDGVDLVRLATAFASIPGAVHYNPVTDLDGDLEVDGNDLAILGASFGDTCP